MVFLADRDDLRNKRLHRRIRNRFQTDSAFEPVQLRVATHRERGPYRVLAETDPRTVLGDEAYPTRTARLEIGFDVESPSDYDFYWFNWIEPERDLLLGWHQDDDHPEHGEVHLQLNQSDRVVVRKPAEFVDEHPLAVLEARLDQLPDAVRAIQWEDGAATGLDW